MLCSINSKYGEIRIIIKIESIVDKIPRLGLSMVFLWFGLDRFMIFIYLGLWPQNEFKDYF